ncbi:MAG: hypothetical protein KDI34_03290 [Halioglobus sp.]|jgi:hypothetical protein|nr:hypothetical protein [Halioglobus sp.]
MMDRIALQWRGETYRLNRGTVSFWPRARLIANPEEATPLRLVTDEAQWLAFAQQQGCVVEGESAEQDPCTATVHALEGGGYTVWSVAQALDHIEVAPESDAASHLMACLTQWFFLEKLPL